MSLTVSEGATGTYTPPEAGTFTARCIGLIDLGTQASTFEGETKHAHKLLVQFELTDPDNRRDDGSAHIVSKRFTASLHPKAALRGFLEAWRGRPFTPQELAGFHLKALLGLALTLGSVGALFYFLLIDWHGFAGGRLNDLALITAPAAGTALLLPWLSARRAPCAPRGGRMRLQRAEGQS